jgi:hypothetical protein
MDGNSGDNFKYIRDSTIMYLDVPIVADLGDFKVYGIEARVRMTRLRDAAIPGAHAVGLVMGIITNPEEIGVLEYEASVGGGLGTNQRITNESRDRAPDMAGVRAPQSNGQWRGHITRYTNVADPSAAYGAANIHGQTTLSGNTYNVGDSPLTADLQVPLRTTPNQLATYADNLGSNDVAATRVEGFSNQEYIVRVMRTQAAEYSAFFFNTDGKFLHASRLVTTNAHAERLVDDTPHYLAFIVSGAEVEISDIRAFYDVPLYSATNNSPVFGAMNDDIVPVWVDSAVAGATPIKDTYAVRLYGTARNTLGADGAGFNYAVTSADTWSDFVIDCQVLPVTMSQAVTWEVVGPDPGIISVAASGTNRLVSRGTGTGEATIKVTSTGSTTVSHRPLAEFKVKIMGPTYTATSVVINNAPAVQVSKDLTITLTATVGPGNLVDKSVTWSASLSDSSVVDASEFVDLNPTTGELKILKESETAATPVYITATSVATPAVTGKATITIRKEGGLPGGPRIWQADVGAQVLPSVWNGNDKITVTGDGAAATLTMKGTGQIGTGQMFNFVYLHTDAAEFTMQVKIDSATFGFVNNSTRIGILAAATSSVTHNPSTGVLTPTSADPLTSNGGMLYAASHLRPNSNTVISQSVNRGPLDGNNTGWNSDRIITVADATIVPSTLIRLQRRANGRFTGSVSWDNGATWEEREETNAAVTGIGPVLIGLMASSADGSTPNGPTTVTYSNLYFKTGTGAGLANVAMTEGDRVDFAWLTLD